MPLEYKGVARQYTIPERKTQDPKLGVPLGIEGVARPALIVHGSSWAWHAGYWAWHAKVRIQNGESWHLLWAWHATNPAWHANTISQRGAKGGLLWAWHATCWA